MERKLEGNDETGSKFDIKVYRRGRKCKFEECNQALSTYNPNEYCFAHAIAGYDKEKDDLDNKRLKAYNARARIYHRNARKRKRNNRSSK